MSVCDICDERETEVVGAREVVVGQEEHPSGGLVDVTTVVEVRWCPGCGSLSGKDSDDDRDLHEVIRVPASCARAHRIGEPLMGYTDYPERPDTRTIDGPVEVQRSRCGGHRFALWHPQWGGYAFPCVVEFTTVTVDQRGAWDTDKGAPFSLACFNVFEFSDGEFPTDDCRAMRHYCDPAQVVSFGLTVIELQVKHSTTPVNATAEELRDWRQRVDDLLAMHQGQAGGAA